MLIHDWSYELRNELYEYCDKLDGAGWAWEFLRRNGWYENDYLAAREQEKSDIEKYGDYPKGLDDLAVKPKHQITYLPEKHSRESTAEWRSRCRQLMIHPRIMTPLQVVAAKWHLEIAEPPRRDRVRFVDPYVPVVDESQIDTIFSIKNGKRVIREDVVVLAIDLDLSLNKQLEKAIPLIKQKINARLQPGESAIGKPQRAKWKLYLRMLDARSNHYTTWQDIYAVLVPARMKSRHQGGDEEVPRKLIHDLMNSARRMTHRYLDCLGQNFGEELPEG